MTEYKILRQDLRVYSQDTKDEMKKEGLDPEEYRRRINEKRSQKGSEIPYKTGNLLTQMFTESHYETLNEMRKERGENSK